MYIKKTIVEMELDSIERASIENLSCEYIEENHYFIHNLDKNTCYEVYKDDNGEYHCNCPHHIYRNVICKHIVKLQNVI